MATKKNKVKKTNTFEAIAAADPVRNSFRGSSTINSFFKSQFANVDEGILPYQNDKSGFSVSDAIRLTQKAYFNVSIFRNTIDIQTEFSNSPLKFVGGSKKSRDFFEAWFKKINGRRLAEQFFREWYRSSNIFSYKTYYQISPEDVQKFKNEYGGGSIPSDLIGKRVPLRYIILNPAEIKAGNASSFVNVQYSKLLNSYEVSRLRNPQTPEEIEFVNSLPADVRKSLKDRGQVLIPLDTANLISVFAKKQDYEPLSVPLYFPVLSDINLKLQFKKAELSIARTVDYAILLITMGDEKNGLDPKVKDAMQTLFKQETVNRVILADWTTKMEFVIPELSRVLGPEKYESVNRDIANGLMNIFFEDQKFANGFIKTQIFLERLNEARNSFINDFLIPEMEEVAGALSLREIPTPTFQEISLDEQGNAQRTYTRLAELGFLTPEEYFEVSKTGIFPTKEDSVQNQLEYKDQREKGLYLPLVGASSQDASGVGRPQGSSAPQTTKKISPQKSVGGHIKFSDLKDSALKVNELISLVESEYKSRNKIQRLSNKHKSIAFEMSKMIVTNERISDWNSKYKSYFDNIPEMNPEINDSINELAAEHNLDYFAAAILFHSKHE